MKRRFSNKIIKKPSEYSTYRVLEFLPLHFTSRIRNIRTAGCHNRQVPGAMTSSNPCPLPWPQSHGVSRADATSQLSSATGRQHGPDVSPAPGICCQHEHGGINVQVWHPCKLQNTLRKNSKCPEKKFMAQGSQQKALEDLSWAVR